MAILPTQIQAMIENYRGVANLNYSSFIEDTRGYWEFIFRASEYFFGVHFLGVCTFYILGGIILVPMRRARR